MAGRRRTNSRNAYYGGELQRVRSHRHRAATVRRRLNANATDTEAERLRIVINGVVAALRQLPARQRRRQAADIEQILLDHIDGIYTRLQQEGDLR